MPVGLISGPNELKHIVRYLMTLKSPTLSSSPLALEEQTGDPTALVVRRTINPVRPNSFSFAPINAKYVRVDVLTSSHGQPCIDELEIFSGKSPKNLALHSSGAKATASSLLKGYEEKHQIEFLNDDRYGNAHSWIPAVNTGWAQIELPRAMAIDRVVLSRDRGGKLTRRVPVSFDILVSMDGKEWKTVKKVRPTSAKRDRPRKSAVQPGAPEPHEAGFTSILDGKSLNGWDHRNGAWKVVDGAITCTGVEKTKNWIIWRGGTPSDFVLRLDFKYEAGNSGVQIRSDDLGDHQVFGYQVEVAAQKVMGLWHHSLLPKDDPAREARHLMATAGQEVVITADGKKSVKQVAAKEEIVAHFRQKSWNRMEIIAEGNTLTQKINGVVFSKVSDDDKRMSRRKGVIALQDHGKGCKVAFRNIRIKDLSRDGKVRPSKATAPEPATLASSAKPTRPNIVLILADDMGYADVERFGNLKIPTPALNRLCDEGVKFTDAYVTAPICVPSRMGLMSGRYQQRFGVYGNFNALSQQKLALRATVMPRPFQQNGYRTGLVGKWHLSGNGVDDWQLPGPLSRGFDECVAITGGGSSFWAGARIIRQKAFEKSPVYLTDLWGKEASAFIERNARRPFFLYLAFNAVHAPLHALDEDIAPFAETIEDPNRRIYAGMQRAMDRAVGRVLNELDKQKIADDTIVIFLNDNGGGGSTDQYPDHSRNYANNSPFRGHKFDVFEGGIRVPMIMRWPGRLKAGSVYSKMVSSADIYRTVVSAAELKMPTEKFDSIDLLPYLTGKEKGKPHDWLCWQNRSRLPTGDGGLYKPRPGQHNCAIRKGNWKLVRLNEDIHSKSRPPAWQLYDLASDVGEQHDIATKHPEVVRELDQLFNAWRADMHPSIAARDRRKNRRPEKK